MDYLILPGITLALLALAHATDPRDINVYVRAWRTVRGRWSAR